MTSATLALIAASAALFFLLLFLSRGKAGTAENILQKSLIVLCLFFAALHLTMRHHPGEKPSEVQSFFLVEEGLLLAELESVAREVLAAAHGRNVTLASFTHPGRRAVTTGPPPGQNEAVVVDARFSSPEAALAWVGLEAVESPDAEVTVISSRRIRLPAPAQMDLRYTVLPFGGTGDVDLSISLPDAIFTGRTLKVKAALHAPTPGKISLHVFDGDILREMREPLLEGETPSATEEFELNKLEDGTHLFRFDVLDTTGRLLERTYRRVVVRKPPQTTWLRGSGLEGPLPEYLGKHGYPISVLADSGIVKAAADEANEILVVLEDVSVARLSWPVVSRLYRAVSGEGMGLLVVGGERSYGPGGYLGTAIERLTPVWMGLKNKDEEKHSTTFLVIVDTSTSMLCPPEGCATDSERMWGDGREARGPRVRKIDLARQALLNLVPSMKDADTFGILGGRASPYWEVEPGPMKPMKELEEKILGIRGGGSGIYLYSSLLEAKEFMSGIDSEIKHIVALIDTDDVDEINILGKGTVEDLILLLKEDDISISFIGLGFSDDKYVPLLNRLASTTGGYLYLTSNITEVPTFLSNDREKLSEHQVIRKHMLTQFSRTDFPALEATPPLEGQFITETKADARTLVWSELGYPVFALRQMGKGVSAALATDGGVLLAPAWAKDEALPLWDGIFSFLQGGAPDDGKVFFSRRGRELTAWYTPGREGAFGKFAATVEGLRAETFSRAMKETFPGIYQAGLGYLPRGSYRFTIGEGEGEALLETVITTSDDAASGGAARVIPAASPLPKGESGRRLPAKRWLRMLLILSAAFAVLYEMVRQR